MISEVELAEASRKAFDAREKRERLEKILAMSPGAEQDKALHEFKSLAVLQGIHTLLEEGLTPELTIPTAYLHELETRLTAVEVAIINFRAQLATPPEEKPEDAELDRILKLTLKKLSKELDKI